MAQLEWTRLCERAAVPDGMIVRDVGAWSERKLHFWHKYIQLTTTAMSANAAWSSLVYVDLFAGPGICRVRGGNRLIAGSPLIAAYADKRFSRILLVERDPETARALENRMSASPAVDRFRVFLGDCNQCIDDVVAEIPPGTLTLAFIDPEGLDANFTTIEQLAKNRRVDLLVLFADAYDVVRNVEKYSELPESKLDATLGPGSGWREEWAALVNRDGRSVRELFSNIYVRQLKNKLGYKTCATMQIDGPSGPLYRLIYASKHEKGLEFWNKCVKNDIGGQGSLF